MTPKRRRPEWSAEDLQPTTDTQFDTILTEPGLPAGGRRGQRKRVIRVPVSEILPDPYQPRPLLPPDLKARFFAGEMDCFAVARAWLERAAQDPLEGARVQALLHMGDSFDEHGQIKPITGRWDAETKKFLLETGERRFWAAVLRAVSQGAVEEPQLEALVVEQPSRARQVLENITAEPPSAVMRAREIAALILEQMGIFPEAGESDFDFYRRVLQIKRLPSQVVREVERLLGISRRYVRYHLQLLQLPDDLLLLADRYRLTEGALREVLRLPPEAWAEAIQELVQQAARGEGPAEAPAEQPPAPKPRAKTRRAQLDPRHSIARRMRTPVRSLLRLDAHDVPLVAEYFASELGEPEQVLRAADALERLARHLRSLAKTRSS